MSGGAIVLPSTQLIISHDVTAPPRRQCKCFLAESGMHDADDDRKRLQTWAPTGKIV